jgi:hypothetical protein
MPSSRRPPPSTARDHGSCATLAAETFRDAAHRAVVAAACRHDPVAYFDELGRRTHPRLDGVDVQPDWRP